MESNQLIKESLANLEQKGQQKSSITLNVMSSGSCFITTIRRNHTRPEIALEAKTAIVT